MRSWPESRWGPRPKAVCWQGPRGSWVPRAQGPTCSDLMGSDCPTSGLGLPSLVLSSHYSPSWPHRPFQTGLKFQFPMGSDIFLDPHPANPDWVLTFSIPPTDSYVRLQKEMKKKTPGCALVGGLRATSELPQCSSEGSFMQSCQPKRKIHKMKFMLRVILCYLKPQIACPLTGTEV